MRLYVGVGPFAGFVIYLLAGATIVALFIAAWIVILGALCVFWLGVMLWLGGKWLYEKYKERNASKPARESDEWYEPVGWYSGSSSTGAYERRYSGASSTRRG